MAAGEASVAGVRVTRHNLDWTRDEEDELLEWAGLQPLATIGKRLGRSAASCRKRLYELGTTASDANGYLSMQGVAKAYGCPLWRVKRLVRTGELKAFKPRAINAYRISPDDCEAIRDRLTAPKVSYKRTPPDVGDYDRRYGLRRVPGPDGLAVRVPA